MKERLEQLDGLRAIAALSVLAFHFTTRYDQVLVHAAPPAFEVPWGGYGVHLFFVISGFVILMTIERGAGPAAFVRSRFARLFPTYWVAVLGTWLLLRFAALPGHQRSVPELLANLTMVHGYFGIASVDGVYWSLGVELLFYLWMLLLACTGALRRPMTVIASAAALCVAAGTAARLAETAVPWTADTLLLLKWAPWFGLGMLAYLGSQGRDGGWPAGLATGALCVAAIAVRGPPADVAVALASAALVRLAAQRRLPVLGARPLVAIGVASYPLYLVHEKIGWLTMLGLQERGLDPTLSIAVATLAAIVVAWALHRAVERPTQAWLRGRPGRTIGPAPRAVQPRAGWAIGLLAILAVLGVGGRWSIAAMRPEPPVREPVAAVDPSRHPEIACDDAIVLLVLGQSNAASHATPGDPVPVVVSRDGRCVRAADPLPGTTGGGGSVWTALDAQLHGRWPAQRFVWAPHAVGATAIAEWTDERAPVREALQAQLDALRGAGLRVEAVLWQQGEADMLAGTPALDYTNGLLRLRAILDAGGVDAPMLVARSTRCFVAGPGAIARRLDRDRPRLAAARILDGPDTDAIGDTLRRDRCHFDTAGREHAAAMWAEVLAPMLEPRAGPPVRAASR